MAANTNPIFTLTANTVAVMTSSASVSRNGLATASFAYGLTAGPNGSRVDRITFTNAPPSIGITSSAMLGRIYISDVNGITFSLYKEVVLPALNPSNTVASVTSTFNIVGGLLLYPGQILAAGQSVYAGTQDQYSVIFEGGNF